MKTLEALLLTLALAILAVFIIGPATGQTKSITTLMIFFSAIWVYVDSSRLKIQTYKVSKWWAMSSANWFVAVSILWPIAFPAYLIIQGKIKGGKISLKDN